MMWRKWIGKALSLAMLCVVVATAGCGTTGGDLTERHPQVDIGTFGVWQGGDDPLTATPRAWIWRAEGYDHVEVWLFHKLNDAAGGGFIQPTPPAGSVTQMKVAYFGNFTYGDGDPLGTASVPKLVEKVRNLYPTVHANNLTVRRFIRGFEAGAGSSGVVQSGTYSVTAAGGAHPTAWIYRSSDLPGSERWVLASSEPPTAGWVRPNGNNDKAHPCVFEIKCLATQDSYANFLSSIVTSSTAPITRKYLDVIDAGVWP